MICLSKVRGIKTRMLERKWNRGDMGWRGNFSQFHKISDPVIEILTSQLRRELQIKGFHNLPSSIRLINLYFLQVLLLIQILHVYHCVHMCEVVTSSVWGTSIAGLSRKTVLSTMLTYEKILLFGHLTYSN